MRGAFFFTEKETKHEVVTFCHGLQLLVPDGNLREAAVDTICFYEVSPLDLLEVFVEGEEGKVVFNGETAMAMTI